MKQLAARLKRSAPVRVLVAFGRAHAANHANALAFQGFLCMFPLILGLLVILGLVIRDPGVQAQVQSAISSVFPSDAGPQVRQALSGVQHAAGPLGIVSILGLLWTGSGFFANLEYSLAELFGTTQRDTLRQRAMGAAMLVVLLVAVLVAVAANSAAAATPLALIAGMVIGSAVLVLLVAAIYRLVPNRTYAFRQVLPGAVVAGVGIEIVTLLFPLYAKVMHGFNSYGQQFALFFLLAAWLLFLSQLILLGAVVVRMGHGAPAEEGLVSAPDDKSNPIERPADAVEEQRSLPGRATPRTPASTRE